MAVSFLACWINPINSVKLGDFPFLCLKISEKGSDFVCSSKSSAISITKTELAAVTFCSSFEKPAAIDARITIPNTLKIISANKEAKKVLKNCLMRIV